MAFNDYFNDNLEDDEFEEQEERVPRKFTVGGKTYNSIEDVCNNADYKDLTILRASTDSEILKTEKLLKKGNIAFASLGILTLAGIAGLFLSGFTGNLKFTVGALSLGASVLGVVGMLNNFKKYVQVEDSLYELYDIYDDIDDEIIKRETTKEMNNKGNTIFPEMF